MPDTWLILAVFACVYAGMALGRWPGLAIDRTGVALVGALVLAAAGATTPGAALGFIDLPTLAILFALMVLSAQVAASGLFDRLTAWLAAGQLHPARVLALVVAAGGGLSALLTNDIVVWSMVPLLVSGLAARGLDPRPHVIALACAANAGSAATVIGNPQNLLIAQHGDLGFWTFLAVCIVPALAALAIVYAGVRVLWPGGLGAGTVAPRVAQPAATPPAAAPVPAAPLDRTALAKAVAATLAVIAVFTLAEDRALWSLAVAAALLVSRTLTTDRMLARVDWHLLLLFAGLFVVTGTLAASGPLADAISGPLSSLSGPDGLLAVSLAGSSGIGNVPLVILVLAAVPGLDALDLYALALFSTLSGNLLIVGSMANIIAVERARAAGTAIGFLAFARIGVPVTLASLAVAWLWIVFAAPAVLAAIG